MGNKKRNTRPSPKHTAEDPKEIEKHKKVGRDEQTLGSSSTRSVQKAASIYQKIERVISYWNALSIDLKKEFLRISVSDLKSHIKSLEACEDYSVMESLSYIESSKKLMIWICCECNMVISDSDLLSDHVMKELVGDLSPEMLSLLPQNVRDEWINKMNTCCWKPLDASVAVKMLEDQANSEVTSKSDESNISRGVEGSVDSSVAVKTLEDHAKSKAEETDITECVEDEGSADASSAVKMLGDQAKSEGSNKSDENIITKGVEGCVDNYAAVKMLEDQEKFEGTNKFEETNIITEGVEAFADSWPLSDDSERATLLERIHERFVMLITHKYMAASHLDKVIKFSLNEIPFQILKNALDQTPTCICFLEAPQLRKILRFLLQLSHACGLVVNAEKGTNPLDGLPNLNRIPQNKVKIDLNEDASCFLLDESLVPTEITGGANKSARMDPFLSWIFSGPYWEDELRLGRRKVCDKKLQGLELVNVLMNKFQQLQNFLEKKCEQTSYEVALQVVEENLCLEEGKKREISTGFVEQSYGSVLRMRRDELTEAENDVTNKYELNAIENVLQEVEAMNASQSDHDKIYTAAIEKLKENVSEELSMTNGKIMRSIAEMDRLKLKIKNVSAFDFRSSLLSLVKSYLVAMLEDMAEKCATKKSDAAALALLAELAHEDSKKDVVKAESDKKKKKEKKTTKNLKF